MSVTDEFRSEPGRYDRNFYLDQAEISGRSARAVVPVLIDAFAPTSVVDLGCGIGTWLAVFEELGVPDVIGVDGSGGASGLLQIDADRFLTRDLTRSVELGRRFDLAMSLEVAEHLPIEAAGDFVSNLTSLATVVAFSAAVPGQGGTGHVNEQWPSWWAERFADHGYRAYDIVRPAVWDDVDVAAYYAQNLLIFAADDVVADHPALVAAGPATWLDVVHPRLFTRKLAHPVMAAIAAKLPPSTKNAVTRRLRSVPFFARP